jgi:hypothetical protein
MKTQANRIGINTMAFAIIVIATLAGCACESSSRPIENTMVVAPAFEVSVAETGTSSEALDRAFRAQADAAALATRNEVLFDLTMSIHERQQMTLAANSADKPKRDLL